MPKFAFKKNPNKILFNKILKAFNIQNINSSEVEFNKITIKRLTELRKDLLKIYYIKYHETCIPEKWTKRIALKVLRQILKTRNIKLHSKVKKKDNRCVRTYYVGYLPQKRVNTKRISTKIKMIC